jgi:hypothetical protein
MSSAHHILFISHIDPCTTLYVTRDANHRTLLCAPVPVYSIYGLSLAFFVLYLCIITLAIEGSELNLNMPEHRVCSAFGSY